MTAASAPRRRSRTPAPTSGSLRRAGLAVAVASTLLLLAYIAEYATVARTANLRSSLRRDLYHERQEKSNLQANVAILERPSRIDYLARTMQMEQRNDADFVHLAPLPAPKVEPAQRPVLASILPAHWFKNRSDKR